MREYIKLCDVCDFQGGSQPPKDEWSFDFKAGYVRMLQIRDFTQSERVAPEYIKITKTTRICEADDILIARYGASLGKILTGLAGAYNVAIMRTIPDTNILEKKYLYYYLKSPVFQGFLLNVGSRAAQAGFNKNDLQDLFIPNITRNEQVEIVRILERVETVIEARQKELQKLDDLIKARFIEMFGDPITNSRSLSTNSLKDTLILKAGDFTEASNIFEEYSDVHPYPCYGGNGVRGFVSEYNQDGEYSLIGRQGALSGNVQFVAGKFKNTEHALLVTPLISMNSIWLNQLLINLDLKRYQTGAAQPGISVKNLQEIQIIMVPIAEQNKFANFVKQVDKSREEVKRSLEKTQQLYDSLMQEYFG